MPKKKILKKYNMNELNVKQNGDNAGNDLDIFELSSRMWNSFKNFIIWIKDLIVFIIIFLIRKSIWIAAFAMTGMILGYVFYNLKKPAYTSSLEGNSGGVDNTVVIDHVNKLKRMTGNNKADILAKYLNLNVEQTEKIKSIRAYYGIDINRDGKPDFIDMHERYNPKDTMQTRLPSLFYIYVSVFDEDIMPTLRNRLFQYINGNSYIQTLYNIDRRQKEDMIVLLNTEISKIDSIQFIDINNKSQRASIEMGNKVFVMGAEPEIRLFYTDILSLYTQKQSLQKSLDISDKPVIIVQDFTPAQFEEKQSLYYIFWLGLAMAAMGLVCSILWQYRKPLWKIITEKDKINFN